MAGERKSPAIIGCSRRSIFTPSGEANSIRLALNTARGIIQPAPVVYGGKIIGLVQGKGVFSDEVRFIPWTHQYKFGWSSWSDLVSETSGGKAYDSQWFKNQTTAPTANNWYDLWGLGGTPTNGSITNTANTATNFSDTTAGAMVHNGNVSTDTKHALSMWVNSTGATCMMLVVDRVLAYDQNAHTNTATTTMTNTNTAARYNTGAPGLNVALVSGGTAQGATAANLTTMTYTDQSNNAAQSMPTTPTVTFIPSAAVNSTTLGGRIIAPQNAGIATVSWGPFLPLLNGDQGVRKVETYVTSSANTGVMTFALVHIIAYVQVSIINLGHEIEQVFQVTALERVFDGACLQLFSYTPTATAGSLNGSLRMGWG